METMGRIKDELYDEGRDIIMKDFAILIMNCDQFYMEKR